MRTMEHAGRRSRRWALFRRKDPGGSNHADDVLSRGGSVGRLAGEEGGHERVEGARKLSAGRDERRQGLVENGSKDITSALAPKRGRTCQRLESNRADCVEIGAHIDGASGDLFWCHVVGGSEHEARRRICGWDAAVHIHACDAEVEEFDRRPAAHRRTREEDVGRLEVEVQDSLGMGC